MAHKIEPVKNQVPKWHGMRQKEYRVTWIDEQGVPRRTAIFAFNMKPVLSTFFQHFPLSTNVTAIQEVVQPAKVYVVRYMDNALNMHRISVAAASAHRAVKTVMDECGRIHIISAKEKR